MWQALSKRDSMYFAAPLLARGVMAAAVEYELAPHATVADMAAQVAAAVLYLHARFPARQIVLVGHSAGGHLAALMLWQPAVAPLLAGIVAASGLFHLEDVRQCYANEALQLTADDVSQFSPSLLAARAPPVTPVPKVLLAFAEHDPTRFREHSAEFAAALQGCGMSIDVKDYAARDHFDLVENLRLADDVFTRDVLAFCGV
jgi:arylformamidase